MTEMIGVVLTRPLRMFLEPLVLFTDLFLLYKYSILYLYFEAYPFIFKGEALEAYISLNMEDLLNWLAIKVPMAWVLAKPPVCFFPVSRLMFL